MLPENRIATHPGEVLREEFLAPAGLTADDLARHLGVDQSHIADIVAEHGPVTAELAWLLAMAFGTSPEFWLRLQATHDLTKTRPAREVARLVG